MAQISVVFLYHKTNFKREQQDVLIRELESLIDQLNLYQDIYKRSTVNKELVWNIMADRYLNKVWILIT